MWKTHAGPYFVSCRFVSLFVYQNFFVPIWVLSSLTKDRLGTLWSYAKHVGLCNAHGVLWVLQMQQIWDEVGENDSERDKMLLQLEQECLEVYRRKVERASHARAQLHQDLANSETELAALFSTLGDPAVSRVSLTDLPAAPTASHLCNNVHTRKNSQNKKTTELWIKKHGASFPSRFCYNSQCC